MIKISKRKYIVHGFASSWIHLRKKLRIYIKEVLDKLLFTEARSGPANGSNG